jgi:hypothetical protein
MAATETCANCGREIGKLGAVHLWQNQTVCGVCILHFAPQAEESPDPAPHDLQLLANSATDRGHGTTAAGKAGGKSRPWGYVGVGAVCLAVGIFASAFGIRSFTETIKSPVASEATPTTGVGPTPQSGVLRQMAESAVAPIGPATAPSPAAGPAEFAARFDGVAKQFFDVVQAENRRFYTSPNVEEYNLNNFKTDVIRTDSVLHPIVGILEFDESMKLNYDWGPVCADFHWKIGISGPMGEMRIVQATSTRMDPGGALQGHKIDKMRDLALQVAIKAVNSHSAPASSQAVWVHGP